VRQIGQRVPERRQLPVEDGQDLGTVPTVDEVVQPGKNTKHVSISMETTSTKCYQTNFAGIFILLAASVSSKKITHRTNVRFSAHAIAKPCNRPGFQVWRGSKSILMEHDFCFHYIFETNFSGHNKIWGSPASE